jgi:hypothetical protein
MVPRPLSVVEAMKELSQVRAIPVKIRGKTIWARNDIHGNAAQLFKTLNVRIPPKILKVEQSSRFGCCLINNKN